MSISISTFPEPLAGEINVVDPDGGLTMVAVIAVAVDTTSHSPRFLCAYAKTGEVTYLDASEVRLFPLLNSEDASGE
jgi:hypothetical protein